MDKKEKRRNQRVIDAYDYLGNAATSGDCTGLIPEGEVKEEDLETYRDIYLFGAPKMEEKKD